MSIRYTLRAMAENYSNGHSWDPLDGEACLTAAHEIATLERHLNAAETELSAVSSAIGSVRWMDPPDGGDVALAEQVRRVRAELERHWEALTPSGDTKADYIGEFQFTVTTMELDESEEPYECQRTVTVPWHTVKEIMSAIKARAERS